MDLREIKSQLLQNPNEPSPHKRAVKSLKNETPNIYKQTNKNLQEKWNYITSGLRQA